MDLALDLDTHDLIVRDYDLALIAGIDLLRQRLKQRLWFFLGEWYLAIDQGVPYFESILGKPVDINQVEAILKATIVQTPGVEALLQFDISFTNATREFSLAFRVRADGDILAMEVTSP